MYDSVSKNPVIYVRSSRKKYLKKNGKKIKTEKNESRQKYKLLTLQNNPFNTYVPIAPSYICSVNSVKIFHIEEVSREGHVCIHRERQ